MAKILKATYTATPRITLKVYDDTQWDEIQLHYYIDGKLAQKGEENPSHFEGYSRYDKRSRFETTEDVKATAFTLAREISASREKQDRLIKKYRTTNSQNKSNSIMGFFNDLDSNFLKGGKKSSSGKSGNADRMKMIQDRARLLKSKNSSLKHTDAVSLASKQLKSEGKL